MTSKYKTDLAQYDNVWYQPGGIVRRLCWYLANRFFLSTSIPYPSMVKALLLRVFGAKIGNGVCIKPKVNIKYPWFLSVGDHVWLGENVWIDNLAPVTIGRNVCISQGAMLLCGNHNYKKRTFGLILGEIVLEDGVWIGAKSIVCPGVICKTHSILNAGSVATKQLEAYSIHQGNPAVRIKTRKMEE